MIWYNCPKCKNNFIDKYKELYVLEDGKFYRRCNMCNTNWHIVVRFIDESKLKERAYEA